MLQAIVRSVVTGLMPVVLGACGAFDSMKDAIEGGDESSEALSEGTPVGPDPVVPTPKPTATAQAAPAPTARPTSPAVPTQPPAPPPAPSGEVVPDDFAGVTWLHTDVSDWKVTAALQVSIGGGTIRLDYDKARTWPSVNGVNANPWIFVFRNNRWYAATFEWLRFGQTSKPVHVVAGDHIKRQPLHDFAPRSGEVYGFMVSGLARDATRNVKERSSVKMVRWP